MSWRTIVITKRAKLDLQLGFMVVRGEHTTKVALNEIAVVLMCVLFKAYQLLETIRRDCSIYRKSRGD